MFESYVDQNKKTDTQQMSLFAVLMMVLFMLVLFVVFVFLVEFSWNNSIGQKGNGMVQNITLTHAFWLYVLCILLFKKM